MIRTTVPPALVFVLATITSLDAQDLDTLVFSNGRVLRTPFSHVVGLVELGNQQLAVADRLENRIAVLNAQGEQLAEIGQQGPGPLDFRRPARLFATSSSGESLVLVDLELRRLLFLSLQQSDSVLSPDLSIAFSDVGGIDSQGRVYMEGRAKSVSVAGIAVDTIPVIRWTPSSSKYDTLGWMRDRGYSSQLIRTTTARGIQQSRIRLAIPFSGRDLWTVESDGTVLVARFDPYLVERWPAEEESVTGPQLPFHPVPVTEADKNAVRYPEEFEVSWPSTKPPFHEDGLIPDRALGGFWLRRYSDDIEGSSEYDVFDSEGGLSYRARFGGGETIVEITSSAVYTVKLDEMGLQWVTRYYKAGG